MNKIFLFFFFLVYLEAIVPVLAVTPMEYYNSLVAGGDNAGFRDGAFISARFNNPSGLCFDDTGNQLFVADSGNQRIRVIYLDRNNDVETLAGTGTAGQMDGPLSGATFNFPTRLAALPESRLAVYDTGSGLIRLIDLKAKNVSTLVKGVAIWDMVYRRKDNCLYFSEPISKKLEKVDLKSLAVSTVFSNNPQVPSPAALCLYSDDICVADENLPAIDELKFENSQSSAPASVTFLPVGNAKDVQELSSSDGFLYAWQKGGILAKVGLPDSHTVNLPTAWGFLFNNQDHRGATPLFDVQADRPVGFSASPQEPRKFYVQSGQAIMSFKDYHFDQWWMAVEGNDRELTDFDYPPQKPARTFRILITGDSRASTAPTIPTDPKIPIDENKLGFKTDTFSKQLEFLLNTEAALRNLNIHFEVLNLTRRGCSISSYGYYQIPSLVKKYNIDLVLGLAGFPGYMDYFTNPITPEGIPSPSVDSEYVLKPLSQRLSSGVAADLWEQCKKLKIPVTENLGYPGDGWSLFCNGDAQIQNDLREMTGRRLQLLNEKLNSLKVSGIGGEQQPLMIIFYVPWVIFPNDCVDSFWKSVCDQYHLNFLDLTESFNALKTGYYPSNQACCTQHYTAYGNELIATLLKYYLIANKYVPCDPNQK